jgi:hypothetical protein
MPEDAYRWELAPARTHRGRVVPGHDVGPGLPRVIVPGQDGEGPGDGTRPGHEQDQTKLYGFVVYSWSDKVLSVQRIWTRTRTR